MTKDTRKALIDICQRSCADKSLKTTVPEPYIPYVPTRWNGVIVLAEAQNHSGDYLADLKKMSARRRFTRLGALSGVGVQPWDDGCLKAATAVVLGLNPENTAVSNGVLWSQLNSRGVNVNPGPDLIKKSGQLWTAMLEVLKPKCVVSAGRVSERVIKIAAKKCNTKFEHIVWPLPSPRVLRPLYGYLDENKVARRFPEIAKAKPRINCWVDKPKRKMAVCYVAIVGIAK